MEIASESPNKVGILSCGSRRVKTLMEKLQAKVIEVAKMTQKLGTDDPRRVTHSLKVGLALTIVSLFYYFQTLYDSFGVSAMWAVMTVVVVFEFSVGATLGKGLNRALATLVAGVLGVAAHHLSVISGKIGEPIILAILVFLQATLTTFARFFPKIKARYDYGMLIFILTFCLVSVSGFRNNEILELARKRLSTILIGASACVIVSIFVCPVWAGEDLQTLVALNIEKLGSFLEGFGEEYFKTSEAEKLEGDKPFMLGYKSVLNSRSTEETLANFARWEPGHGRFLYCHPWKQYLKVGALTRECAYRVEALNGYLNSDIQIPAEIREKVQDICTKMSLDCGKAMKELAFTMKTMTKPSSSDSHVANSKAAAENLKCLLKSELWKDIEFVQVIAIATITSVLIEIVICVENIAESVHELALLAKFKSVDTNANNLVPEKSQTVKSTVVLLPVKSYCPEVVITVNGSAAANSQNKFSCTPRIS